MELRLETATKAVITLAQDIQGNAQVQVLLLWRRDQPGVLELLAPSLFTSTSSPSLPIHFYKHAPSTRSTALHTTTQRWRESSAFWLSLYFLLNLGLTLHNKALLRDFPFPYTVTAVHSLFSSVGGYAMRRKRLYVPAQLSVENELVLLGFSVIYALNIAVSNVSLQKVTIPFHQAIRSLTPFLVLALSSWLLQSKCSPRKLLALVPVMVGVALATFGDYASTPSGLVVTLLGAFLAALKGLSTSLLQARRTPASSQPLARFRLGLHPHDLLARMSPLALVQCLFYAQSAGELARAARAVSARQAALLGANGVLAFGLNIVSFTANRRAGALSMSVASNVKQVLTVLLAVVIFDSRISRVNAYGVALTLLGGGWYAWVEHTEKKGPEVEGGSIRTRQ